MAVLTAAAVLTLASAYGDWDPNVAVWLVFDAGTGNGESSGRTDAISPDGKYVGLLQVDWRLHGYTVEQLKDPAFNIEVAHRLWLERGWQPWPSAVKYPGATAMTNGICPFARQVYGVSTFQPGNGGRVGFCDHTAGGFFGTMLRADFWNDAGTSVHFAISRDGEVAQIVNIFDTAFAQGRLGPKVTWPAYAAMGNSNPNLYMISTEHEDWTLVNGKAVAVPGSQWTAAEYAADLRVKRWCIDEVKRVKGENLMRFGIDSLAGHYMFDGVNRAECPGRFWRNDYRQRLYADLTAQEDEIMRVHNTIATNLQGATGGATVGIDSFDQPPPASKMLRVELYLKDTSPPGSWDGALQVMHANGDYAGQVGWDGARYGCIDVTLPFSLKGDGVVAQLGVIGYWA